MVLGAEELRNDVMINSASASSNTLRDDTVVKVEAGLPIL